MMHASCICSSFWRSLLIYVTFYIGESSQDHGSGDTVICGGFVKSDFPIDYGKIEIRLLDKAGNLKYQAPCATNNGNYEVPVFGKKGQFILTIAGPEGLNFEPTSIPVTIDGSTDPCSTQQNINFHFIGYSLHGKVHSKGSTDGPAGVAIKLMDKANKEVFTTVTENGGKYSVPSLLPGTYTVEASHPLLVMDKAKTTVVVKDNTLYVPDNSLTIRGYPLNGHVKSSGEPITDVKFILYSKQVNPSDISDCDKNMTSDLPKDHPQYGKQLCGVRSDVTGKFAFASLVPGVYTVVPTYKGGDTKYDIEPSQAEITVAHEPAAITKVFEVKGFTASGSVFTSPTGSGVPSAEIYLNGTLVTKTDKKGIYRLEKTVASSILGRIEINACSCTWGIGE